MKLAVRGFEGKIQIFEEMLELEDPDTRDLVWSYAKQLLLLHSHDRRVEVEFLKDPLHRRLLLQLDPDGKNITFRIKFRPEETRDTAIDA